MSDNNEQKNVNEKPEVNQVKEKNENNSNSNNEKNKIKLGTLANFILAAFVVLIIGTGALTYYLIHSAKDDYDKQYNEIISNLPNTNSVTNTSENQITTIANMIDSAVSAATNQTNTNTTVTDGSDKKLMNESLVVLYNGLILDTSKMDEVTLQYIDSTVPESDKYVITYYSYENYSKKDSSLGMLSSQVYDGLAKIDNVGKIAISEDYNAIPRNIKVVNTVPTIISDNNPKVSDYDSIKTLIADLDGNGTDEYILVMANKTTGYSKITAFDSKGAKIADLASIEKSKWKKDSTTEYYLSISNVEIIDVDNDGIMEMVIEIPHATGNPTISLLKYNNGVLQGKTDIECSLLSE